IGAVGEVEGGEDGAGDLLGAPAADVTAAMQEHFEQADDAGVVDLDAGIADHALLAYYDPDGRLVYAGRAGTGIKQAELERLWRRLQPLSIGTMPLDVP